MRPLPKSSAILPLLAGLAVSSFAQDTWSLSGKVVDAEEGNGLGSVTVSLARAGLRTTTAKNGDWSIASVSGVERPSLRERRRSESFLHLQDGRLLLRMEGVDLLGRNAGLAGWAQAAPATGGLAGRAAATTTDTIVYSRDGYIVKRVPLGSNQLSGILDSIRRIRYPEWVDSSHSNGFKPDTTDAFVDTLRHLTFRFAKADWDHMMQVMTDSCGRFGVSSGFGGTSTEKSCQASQYDLVENTALVWVPADILADGQVWRSVGIRLKGNASLATSWSTGTYSLPWRVTTDKFEDSLPTTKNQRFHGFKKLSFFNLMQDTSGVRGAVAGEIFRLSGIAAPMSVPVQIALDRGDGIPLDVGIYEMLEVPDSPFLNRHFGNDSGNLYKPLSKLDKYVDAEWVDEDVEGDYADAKALIALINSTERTSDPAAWRAKMEKAIDVPGFLKWLAVSTAILNWDAYGVLAHNYFLYNDGGRFRWITYDFGWSFDYAMASSGIVSRTSVWYDQTGGFFSYGPFPLVANLLAQESYCQAYRGYLEAAIAADGPASVASFQEKVDRFGAMVSVLATTRPAVAKLRGFMDTRIPEVKASLAAKTCPIPPK